MINEAKYLGIQIDKTLSWKEHINIIASKIARGIGVLRYAKRYVPLSTIKTMYRSIVDPYLRYCCTVWGCCSMPSFYSVSALSLNLIHIKILIFLFLWFFIFVQLRYATTGIFSSIGMELLLYLWYINFQNFRRVIFSDHSFVRKLKRPKIFEVNESKEAKNQMRRVFFSSVYPII